MSDKVRDIQQYNQLKAKYIGLGNPDTTRKEFFTNVHRDSLALIIGHDQLLNYTSIVLNQHPEITRQQLLRRHMKPL
jgi:splicing factor 3B subunit 5